MTPERRRPRPQSDRRGAIRLPRLGTAWLSRPSPGGHRPGDGPGYWCRKKLSTPCGCPGDMSLATYLIPWRPSLGRRHAHGAGQVEQVGRAGEERPLPLDSEDHLVTVGKAQRITNRPRDGDLTFRGHSCRDVHLDPPYSLDKVRIATSGVPGPQGKARTPTHGPP